MLTNSPVRGDVIYRESLGRPLSPTTDLQSMPWGWQSFRSNGVAYTTGSTIAINGSADGRPTTLANVNAGLNSDGTSGAYARGLYFYLTGEGTRILTFTPEFSFNPANYTTNSVVFSWYQGNQNTVDTMRLAIRIGSQWYASASAFANNTSVTLGAFTTGAELKQTSYNPTAANWLFLNFNGTYNGGNPGSSVNSSVALSLGSAPSSNLSGTINAFGIYVAGENGTRRWDTFQIDGTPLPPIPTKLAITSINGGANPTAGTGFSVVVEAQDAGGTARNVTANTAVSLSLNTGSGTLGGTLTGTITAGTSSVTISAVTYTAAESGVVLTSTRTSGDTVTAGNSAPVTVIAPIPWYNASWTYRLAIVIDRTKVAGPLTNFPVLINLTNASLQASALSSGNDLLFTTANGTTKLDHEIERYTNSNGALVAWVKVPILSSTVDTTLYLYYGNAAATNQQNATAVWDSSFKAVYHLKETTGNFNDSTANANRGTNFITATGKTGQIGSGQQFDGTNDYINAGTFDPSSADLTISFWAKWNGANTRHQSMVSKRTSYGGSTMRWQLVRDVTLSRIIFISASSTADFGVDIPDSTSWHHYTVTRSGTTCTLRMDGAVYGNTATLASYSTGTNAQVVIGGTLGQNESWNGNFDEVRISGAARSAAWIATEYNNQSSPAAFYSVGSQELQSPTKLAITSVNAGSSPTAGTAFNVVVQAQNAGGTPANVVSNTAVTLSLNTGSGTLGGTLTGTITAGNNYVTISGVTYTKAESVVLTATRTGGDSLTAGNSSSFTVIPGALHHFGFAAIGTQTAASAFNATMTAQDANNNTVTSFTGTANLSTTAGTISPTVSGTFTAGTRTESVTLTQAGSGKTITATKAGGSETGTSASFTVNPGAIHHYAITASSPQTAGANFTVTVTAQDINNNTVTTDSATVVTLTGTGSVQFDSNGNGTFGDNTKTLSSGAFTITTKDTVAQSITITAMDGNSKTGTSSSITVSPGAIDHYAVSASTPQTVGSNFNTTVTAKDSFNNTVTTASGTVVTLTGTGSVQFDSDSNGTFGDNTKTLSSGAFTIRTMDTVAESVTITATDGTSKTGTSASITIQTGSGPAAIDHYVVTASSPQTAGSNFNTTVTAKDSFNNVVTTDSATVVTLTGTGSAQFDSNGDGTFGDNTKSLSNGVFTIITRDIVAEGITLTATDGNNATGTSSNIVINAGPIDHYATDASTPQTAGTSFNTTVTAKDSFNNTVTLDSSTVVTLTGTGGAQFDSNGNDTFGDNTKTLANGAFTISTKDNVAETITLTATDGNAKTGTSSSITINPANSALAVSTSANPSPTGSNVTFTATVTAVSPASGNPSGTVQFLADGAALGSPAALSGGTASVSSSSLSRGTHSITAQYAGDSGFLGSTNSLSPNQVINAPPVAANDTLERYPTAGLKVRTATLLTNDTDPDSDALTFVSVSATSVSGGTNAVLDGWIAYTPPGGFTNADSFTYVVADSGGLQATGSVSITIRVDLDAPQNVAAIEDLGINGTRVHFLGIPGLVYTVQYTTNLVTPDWQSLGTNTADATGAFEFTDSSATNSPPRFYRSTHP